MTRSDDANLDAMSAADERRRPAKPRRPFRRLLWKGAGLLALLMVTFAVGARFAAERPDASAARSSLGGDFLVAYSAGTLAREGRYAELHDSPALGRRMREVSVAAGLPPASEVGPWLNPPFFLWPFVALTALPYHAAFAVWSGVSLASMAAACLLLARMLRPRAPDRRLRLSTETAAGGPKYDWRTWGLVPVLMALSMPAALVMTHGQSSAVSLLLLTAAVAFWRGRRAFLAGATLGLLFYKPQLAALAAAVMVLDLGRRAFLGLAATGACLLLLCALLMPEELSLYLRHATSATAGMQANGLLPWNRHVTFTAFWRQLLQGHGPGATTTTATALALSMGLALIALLLLGAARHRRPGLIAPPRADLPAAAVRRNRLIAAAVVVTPLAMPYYVDYDLLLLAVPAVLLAADPAWAGRPPRLDRAARWTWVVLFLWLDYNAPVAMATGISPTTPLLALLAVAMAVRACRRATQESAGVAAGLSLPRLAA